MKRLLVALLICGCTCVLICGCTSDIVFRGTQEEMHDFAFTRGERETTEYIFGLGCVPDEAAAAEIATTILKAVYGEDFDHGLPLLIDFDTQRQVWLIKTQLLENTAGGAKYIIIKKSNAEILGIWATL